MSLDQEAWAEIARLWLDGTEPLGRIAERFAITHQAITAYARRKQWPPRGGAVQSQAAGWHATQSRNGRRSGGDDRRATEQPGKKVLRGGGAQRRERTVAERSRRPKRDRARARNAMVERLFDAMDTKLSAIEERIASGGDATSADSERTTRALNTLVRSLEKLSDYEGKISNSARRDDGKRRQAPDDPERRRHELARRIERLLKRR